jgi:membrane protein DedA with SNARE-associated domain
MSSIILAAISSLGLWNYLIIFLAMIIEGDPVLFSVFFLANEGVFSVAPLLIVVFLGVLVGDLFWYWLGIKLDKQNSKLAGWAEKIAAPFDEHLISRTFHTIFISKFTYGTYHAILVRAGMLRFPIRRFIGYDAISTLVWMAVVGGLGYFSSYSFSLIKQYIKIAEVGLLVGILFFIFLSKYISKRSRQIL